MKRVAIAIGSNLGDRDRAISFATTHLAALLTNFSVSDTVETWPLGEGTENQNLYLNAAAVGETSLSARQLLDSLLAIEGAFGREENLEVPHPRFRDRFFVLGPLAEVAADMVDPVTGLRVGELLRELLRDESR